MSSPQVIVVNSDAPYRTLTEFITDAHARPGQLTFATVGPATTQHIGFEQLKRLANIDVIYVPYPGGAPAISALLGGHIHAVLANYSEVQEQLQAGKVRALASTSQTRIGSLPDVPSVAESGYKDYNVEVWFGVMAPAKTPKDTVAQLANWFRAAINAPEVTSSSSAFIRLALASTTSPHTSVTNTTNTVALSARQTLRANSVR